MLIKNLVKNSFKILQSVLLLVIVFSSLYNIQNPVRVFAVDITGTVFLGDNKGTQVGQGTCKIDDGYNTCFVKNKAGTFDVYSSCISDIVGDGSVINASICATKTALNYPTQPTFDQIKNDLTKTSPPSDAFTFGAEKYTIKDSTAATSDGVCDFVAKICKSTTQTFSECVKETTTEAKCGKKVTGLASNPKELAGISTATTTATNASINATSGGGPNLFEVLMNIVIAIVTLLVFIVSTAAYFILSLFAFLFIFFVKINPASNEWITVAQAPWGVVQSLANLLILASFIFVAFSYILNIKQYKTKIDSFLTNIVIVAIVVQDRKSTRLNSSHRNTSRMPSSA